MILLFVAVGTMKMDLKIYYIQAPESGFDGKANWDLEFGITSKIVLCSLALLESIFVTLNKLKLSTISIVLAIIRMLPPFVFVALDLLIKVLNDKDCVMNISYLIYLMLLLSVGSLITNILNRNSISKSNLLNEG